MVQVNGWQYGYWNAMEHILHFMREFNFVPRDLIMVLDGEDGCRLRRAIYPAYKSGRRHAPEQVEQFDLAFKEVKAQLLAVGASAVQQQYREADDVIGYLAQNLPTEIVIDTIDKNALADTHFIKRPFPSTPVFWCRNVCLDCNHNNLSFLVTNNLPKHRGQTSREHRRYRYTPLKGGCTYRTGLAFAPIPVPPLVPVMPISLFLLEFYRYIEKMYRYIFMYHGPK
jgi:hypothetical protein